MTKNNLIIDVGGTNLKFGLFDGKNSLIKHGTIATQSSSLHDFIVQIKGLLNFVEEPVDGIGFSVPGTVDHDNGKIYGGGSLPFLDHVRLADYFDIDGPIIVENDAKAAVLGESWQGNLADVSDGAAIVLGTAVGGGIIINGRLLAGTHNQAGELSFIANWRHGKDEDIIGNFNSAVTMVAKIADALNIPNNGMHVFSAIEAKNPIALKLFDQYCYNVAVLINNIQCVVDLQRYVIGGGISARECVTENINKQYNRVIAHNPAIGIALSKPEIVSSKLHNDANMYGALHYLLDQVKNDEEN